MYALGHSTKDALEKFAKQYPKFTFKGALIKLMENIVKEE